MSVFAAIIPASDKAHTQVHTDTHPQRCQVYLSQTFSRRVVSHFRSKTGKMCRKMASFRFYFKHTRLVSSSAVLYFQCRSYCLCPSRVLPRRNPGVLLRAATYRLSSNVKIPSLSLSLTTPLLFSQQGRIKIL